MKVNEQDVAYVAELAHLELSDEERARLVRDLNSILGYIEHLNELNTDKVAPMAQVVAHSGGDAPDANAVSARVMRDDVHNGLRESLPHDLALQNAPEADGTFFIVPKVIER